MFPFPLPERQVAWLEAVYSNQAKEKGFLPFTLLHQQEKGKVPKEAHQCNRLGDHSRRTGGLGLAHTHGKLGEVLRHCAAAS